MKRTAALLFFLLLILSAISISSQALSISYGHFNGEKEYEAFLEESFMPQNYIHASRFTLLGSFESGAMHSSTHQSYHYSYASGYSVHVHHGQKRLSFAKKQLEVLPSNTVSMTHTASILDSGYYYYFRNGLYYIYSGSSGNLYSLEWFANGIHFSIYVYERGRYSPTPVIDQLLSVSDEVATAAFNELCDSAGLSPHRMHYTQQNAMVDAIVTTIITAAVVLTIVLTYFAKRKYRKYLKSFHA